MPIVKLLILIEEVLPVDSLNLIFIPVDLDHFVLRLLLSGLLQINLLQIGDFFRRSNFIQFPMFP